MTTVKAGKLRQLTRPHLRSVLLPIRLGVVPQQWSDCLTKKSEKDVPNMSQKRRGESYIVGKNTSRSKRGEAYLGHGAPGAPLQDSQREGIMNDPCITDDLQADQRTITDAFGFEHHEDNEVREVAEYIHSLELENAALRQRIALLRGIPQLA
jgi:hypothetical protein